MILSEKKYKLIFELLLLLIATTIIFRKPCTYIIIVFFIFCLLFYKKLNFPEKAIKPSLIIILPLITELLFFWNNDSLLLGIKSLEKSISLIIFPILIIGNYKRVDFYKITRYYSVITTLIILVFYISYVNYDDTYVNLYSKSEDYFWAIGYSFANYVGMHGPALNMHLAFVAMCNFYFAIYLLRRSFLLTAINFLLFFLSFYFVVFINSKLALANLLVGIIIIFYIELRKKFNVKNLIGVFLMVMISLSAITYVYVQKNPYMITKYRDKSFAYFDKIGNLDTIKDPDSTVYHSFATRISIWKATLELASKNILIGVGASDSKTELIEYFKSTNQKFLARHKFPVHNQFLDSLLKFGIIGFLSTSLYMFNIYYIGIKTSNTIITLFFILFFSSNLTDDFLIRFDGIVFSGFWLSIFMSLYISKTKI
jgi:O-antigen ligase